MAWNEPGDNKNDKDPWTGKSRQNGPPDLEALLRKVHKTLLQFISPKGKGTPPETEQKPFKLGNTGITTIAVLVVLAWALWGIFIVDPAEKAVILQFGKYSETVGPGPHWIPRGIDSSYVVNEQQISNYSYSAEMLTKDQNIVSVAVAVQYRIGDARSFLFNAVNPEESLRQATASALRQVIGRTNLVQVLTSGREEIRQQVQNQLTSTLDKYQTGLLITDVAIQPAKAPDEVKEAFDDAIKAQEDEQRYENQAQAYAMQVIPTAKGQAQRLLADANGYQQQIVLKARAETAPFLALLPQYQNSPVITRERLYLGTLQTVLTNSTKIFLDTNNNNLVYLPLDKLVPSSATTVSPPLAIASSTTSPPAPAPANPPSSDSGISRWQGGY